VKIVTLGTGTSVGVPMIGCSCAVCASPDPRNRRLRSSLYVEAAGIHIVVDTPPDFREQMLRYRVPRLDAVLFTHSHADHIFGLDDIRRFNTLQGGPIPVCAAAEPLADLRRVFYYVERGDVPPGTYRPQIEFREIAAPFEVGSIRVEPLPVIHGRGTTLGFRFECEGRTLGYVPDCHEMPEDAERRLRGVDVMVLDGLRHRPHPTHLTVGVSVKLLQRIGAGKSYLIHMSHDLDHAATEESLPDGIRLAYDGMTLEW
jgi:phosphoribosyl 1,2-cyclic phosphate phosphodiesterase